MNRFNVRVYAIIINKNNEILLADEERFGQQFTKFPGGGLEFGEGTIECIKRECIEELGQEAVEVEHFYTTDYFQPSAFNRSHQLLSIYYKVKLRNDEQLNSSKVRFDFKEISDEMIALRWLPLSELSEHELTFPIDKKVVRLLTGKNEDK